MLPFVWDMLKLIWWYPDELEEGEEPLTADMTGLRSFLEDEVLPWFERRKLELANRPLIHDQAFGEARTS
jgi:hypothetical protein